MQRELKGWRRKISAEVNLDVSNSAAQMAAAECGVQFLTKLFIGLCAHVHGIARLGNCSREP